MKIEIGEITNSIKYGPYLISEEVGSIKYLKGNHFNNDYELKKFEYSYINPNEKHIKYLLKEGDILLAAKGFRNYAWRYSAIEKSCIASSLFFVIKINEEIITSEYFTLSINTPKMLHRIKTINKGVTTPIIPKKEFLKIKIEIPKMERQKEIVSIYNLMEKEIQLERKIIEKKKMLQNGLIDLLIKNELPTNKKVL